MIEQKFHTPNSDNLGATKSKDKQDFVGFKLFDKYDVSEVVVEDPALKTVINLDPLLIPKTNGRKTGKFEKAKVNIVERLVNRLAVAGHRGKKHKFEIGDVSGKFTQNMKIILEVFSIIEKQTGKNPVQVLVRAVENAAPRDEITVIEYGGARYPQAVDVSPLRRVNFALRSIVHGAGDKAFNKKKTIVQGLVEEIILAADNNGESSAVKKKIETEKQAQNKLNFLIWPQQEL